MNDLIIEEGYNYKIERNIFSGYTFRYTLYWTKRSKRRASKTFNTLTELKEFMKVKGIK